MAGAGGGAVPHHHGGRTAFSSYGWEGPPEQYRELSSRVFRVDPAKAEKILEAVTVRFNNCQSELIVDEKELLLIEMINPNTLPTWRM